MDTLQKLLSKYNKADWLVFIFILVIPWTHKEMFSFYNPDLVISKWILIVIATLGFFYFIKDRKTYSKDIFFFLLSGILWGQIFSLLHTLDVRSTLKIIAFQGGIVFAYPFLKNYLRKEGKDKTIFAYLISLSIVLCFWIFQVSLKIYFNKLTGGIWPVYGYPTRFGSTFWDVNHYGAYLSSMIFVTCGVLLSKQYEKYKKFLIALVSVSLLSLFFTGSRSSWIGFTISLVVFFLLLFSSKKASWFNFDKKNKYTEILKYKWHLLSAGFIVLPFSILYLLQDSIRAAFLYRSTSFFSHLYLLKAGISVGINNFTTGIGANAFHAYFKQSEYASAYYYIDKAAENYKLPLHNLWLEVLAETGIVAFIVFCLLWIVTIGLLYRLYQKHNDYLALGLISGLITYLVSGLFYSYKSEFFWIFVVIACVYASRGMEKDLVINKFKDIKQVFYYIFGNAKSFKKLLIVVLSVLTVLSAGIYLTYSLSLREILSFYDTTEQSYVFRLYQYIINLLRFTLGNYSFTGRLPVLGLVISSFIGMFAILNRKSSPEKSILVSAIVINILMILASPSRVSEIWLNIFLVVTLTGAFFILFDVPNLVKVRFNFSTASLVVILVISNICFHVVNYRIMQDGYNQESNFIVELASNRAVLNNSVIWVETDQDRMLVKYYSDHIEKSHGNLYPVNEKISNLTELYGIDFYNRNVFVVTGLNKNILESALVFDEVITYKDYYILIMEPVEYVAQGSL